MFTVQDATIDLPGDFNDIPIILQPKPDQTIPNSKIIEVLLLNLTIYYCADEVCRMGHYKLRIPLIIDRTIEINPIIKIQEEIDLSKNC